MDRFQPLGQFILIKQVLKPKQSKIIRTDGADMKDKFDFSSEVITVGPDCLQKITAGDHPIFSEYAKLTPVFEELSDKKRGMIHYSLVHENDIIGIDREAKSLEIEPLVTVSN